eukprot:8552513-Alexandrium_andersonii.AAC.1
MGKRMALCGDSMLCCYTGAHQVLADDPALLTIECTMLFNTRLLRPFSGRYTVMSVNLSLVLTGVPASRPR